VSALRIENAIEIEAPIAAVWSALTDVDAYPAWNPFVVRVDLPAGGGALRAGTPLGLDVRFPNGRRFRAVEVVEVASFDGERARWAYAYAGLVVRLGLYRSRREHTLERLGEARTRYRSLEDMDGPLFPILRPLIPIEGMRVGFDQQSRALKERCESAPSPAPASPRG